MFRALLLASLALCSLAQDSSVVIATTVTEYYTAAAPTTPLSAEYTNDLSLRTSVLNSTNFYRYAHSAGYIYWNETLAEYAQAYSEGCVWEHSYGAYGENLARGYTNVTAAVEAWGNERDLYDFDADSPTGFTEETGHFTQLVWRSTQATGCGWTDCDGRNGLDGVYLVCEYWPPGNIVGEDDLWFESNVMPERQAGGDGFSELDATRGATGGTPTPTGPAPTATGDESIGAPTAEINRGGWLVTACVTIAAFAFGLGVS